MEFTQEQIENMIKESLDANPAVRDLVTAASFKTEIAKICERLGIDAELTDVIERETTLVATFYIPFSKLAGNIEESTGLPHEKVLELVASLDAFVLWPLHEDLVTYDEMLENALEIENAQRILIPDANLETKERLDLMPSVLPAPPLPTPPPSAKSAPNTNLDGPQPLTKEAIMNALTAKRTMATDTEIVRQRKSEGAIDQTVHKGPVVGN